MSDVEEQIIQEEVEIVEEQAVSMEDCLKKVLRLALVNDGLARGLRESAKALTRGEAQLCILCDAVTEAGITKLVEALCQEGENNVPLLKVADAKQLGEWAGLCQVDREGNARKVVGASCIVITNWGADSEERSILLETLSQE